MYKIQIVHCVIKSVVGHIRLINLKGDIDHFDGYKNSNRTDRV
jgi:hypothetical protein